MLRQCWKVSFVGKCWDMLGYVGYVGICWDMLGYVGILFLDFRKSLDSSSNSSVSCVCLAVSTIFPNVL